MFKLEASVDRYLLVNPRDEGWTIKSSLNAENALMKSFGSSQSCPAHPNNFDQESLDINMSIKVNEAGEEEKEKWEDGSAFLRCSIHDAVHGPWLQLVDQAREGQIEKEKVGALLCEQEDDVWPPLLSFLDKEVQKEVSLWNQNKTNKIAHLLSPECIQWIVQQACEGNWEKEAVVTIVFKKKEEGQPILAILDEKTQKQVAVFNKEKTCSAVPYMEKEGNFLRWLYQEAVEGRWNQQMVFAAVVKEEVDGKEVFTSRIKQGMSYSNIVI